MNSFDDFDMKICIEEIIPEWWEDMMFSEES